MRDQAIAHETAVSARPKGRAAGSIVLVIAASRSLPRLQAAPAQSCGNLLRAQGEAGGGGPAAARRGTVVKRRGPMTRQARRPSRFAAGIRPGSGSINRETRRAP